METARESNASEQVKRCQLCWPSDNEVIFKLRSLVSLMEEFSRGRFRDRKSLTYTSESDKYKGALQKLLRFLFSSKFCESENFNNCHHHPLYSYYKTKTNYEMRQIDILCAEIYEYRAKRDYQLQMIDSQVKCFPKSICSAVSAKEVSKQSQSQPSKVQSQPQQPSYPEQEQMVLTPIQGMPTSMPYAVMLPNHYMPPQSLHPDQWGYFFPIHPEFERRC